MDYTNINHMKKSLKSISLLTAVAIAAYLSTVASTFASTTASTTQLNNITISDIINHFVIEEINVNGGCAYIRGYLDVSVFGVVVEKAHIIHCGERIYVFAELLQQPP